MAKKKSATELANYYDEVDLEKAFDFKKAKIVHPQFKRINLNISESQVELATSLAQITGNGYQNMIKTAISIGLHQLAQNIRLEPLSKLKR